MSLFDLDMQRAVSVLQHSGYRVIPGADLRFILDEGIIDNIIIQRLNNAVAIVENTKREMAMSIGRKLFDESMFEVSNRADGDLGHSIVGLGLTVVKPSTARRIRECGNSSWLPY